MICKICGKEFEKNRYNGCCSCKCYDEFQKWNKDPNCECPICHKKFYIKPSRLKKTQHKPCCSRECGAKYKSEWFSGEGNHQFGLKGELNASFKGKKTIQHNHNVDDIMVYVPEHPYKNKSGRVAKHRLLIEQNYHLFDKKFFLNIGGTIVLDKKYSVHHKDGNHNNNDIENLEILTRNEHSSHHAKEYEIIRNENDGRIIGIVKREELLKNLEINN